MANIILNNDTRDGVFQYGHRAFVGGTDDFHWAEIGKLQHQFLLDQGLLRHHVFFDIACGSLRGGRLLIPYLDQGRYHGFDKYVELVILGVMNEIGHQLYIDKRPFFVIGDDFRFDSVASAPDFAIAQSLFSHLTVADIMTCLTQLRSVAKGELRFFATFFEADSEQPQNPGMSDSHLIFRYAKTEMAEMASRAGFDGVYHGAWGHPRRQMMFEFRCG